MFASCLADTYVCIHNCDFERQRGDGFILIRFFQPCSSVPFFFFRRGAFDILVMIMWRVCVCVIDRRCSLSSPLLNAMSFLTIILVNLASSRSITTSPPSGNLTLQSAITEVEFRWSLAANFLFASPGPHLLTLLQYNHPSLHVSHADF